MTHRTWTVLAAAALALAGCAGDDEPETGPPPGATTEPAPTGTSPGTPAPDASAPDTSAPDPAGAGVQELPPPDSCVTIDEAPDGRYTVAEAGTAVVTREGDALVLGEVEPGAGWTYQVEDEERDEVEIEFRRDDGTEVDLEVELDDGRTEVKVCSDDD